MIQGYHEYKRIWDDPVDGDELECKREIGNSHDTHAVAVQKVIDGEEKTVGHVPRKISAICSLFIRRGGTINSRVDGHRRYSADLPQGGLEIPCILTFVANNHKEGEKAKQLIESTLSIEVCQELESESNQLQSTSSSVTTKSTELEVVRSSATSVIKSEENTVDQGTQSPQKKRTKYIDTERIIMDEELSDLEINFAQQLLKEQFPKLNGLVPTLYQDKKIKLTEASVRNKIQIIHCKSRHHWVVASTVDCCLGEVKVYDSYYQFCDKELKLTIKSLFQYNSNKPVIKVAQCQRQKGSTDCGVFALANATAIAYGVNPSKLKLQQDALRAHLVNCFNKKHMSLFPCN